MFALFFGSWNRNPEGGWGDFKEVFNTVKEAMEEFFSQNLSIKDTWFHVVNLETCEIVYSNTHLENGYKI